jgi:hypothetical protein
MERLDRCLSKAIQIQYGNCLDRTSMMTMKKRSQESVKAYVQRWRDETTNVEPSLIETNMITLFANTFKSFYYKHLMDSLSKHFYDSVHIIERIKQKIISYLNDYI